MNQVDSYLDAIRRLLPRENRDDVVAELGDALVTEIEAEQRAHGRELTPAEIAGVLSRFGAPRDVASRYGARSYLIGPAMYPVFVFLAKAVAMLIGLIAAIRIGVVAFGAEEPLAAIAGVVVRAGLAGLVLLAIVALILARAERLPMPASTWTFVPQAPTTDCAPRSGWGTRPVVPRRETLSSLAWLTFWLVWWTGALPLGEWVLWRWLPVTTTQIVTDLTPFVIWLLGVGIAADLIVLLRPRLARLQEAGQVAVSCGLLSLSGLALRTGTLVVAAAPGANAAQAAKVTNIVMVVSLAGLALVSIAYVVEIGRGWTRSTRGHGDSSASASA